MNVFRRKYFIYPEIQMPLLKIIFVGLFMLSVFQTLGIYLVMKWLEVKTQVDMSILVDYRIFNLWNKFLIFSILFPIILNFTLGIFIVLFFSNKFAGPLYRIEKEIDEHLKNSDKKLNIQFRKGDYLTKLAHRINQLHKK